MMGCLLEQVGWGLNWTGNGKHEIFHHWMFPLDKRCDNWGARAGVSSDLVAHWVRLCVSLKEKRHLGNVWVLWVYDYLLEYLSLDVYLVLDALAEDFGYGRSGVKGFVYAIFVLRSFLVKWFVIYLDQRAGNNTLLIFVSFGLVMILKIQVVVGADTIYEQNIYSKVTFLDRLSVISTTVCKKYSISSIKSGCNLKIIL